MINIVTLIHVVIVWHLVRGLLSSYSVVSTILLRQTLQLLRESTCMQYMCYTLYDLWAYTCLPLAVTSVNVLAV
jgi:hypothetical protein